MIKRMLSVLFFRPADIYGTWIEEIDDPNEISQGFVLFPDGQASSVNTNFLKYLTWHRYGDLLVLIGKSVWGHQTIEFSETFKIKKLKQDLMILSRDGETFVYLRQK